MGILLYSDMSALVDGTHGHLGDGLTVLLAIGDSDLAPMLETCVDDLLVIDVTGPRLSRLNFDAIGLAIVDLTAAELQSSGGRRLIDVLGRLAEESLTLAFYGAATATAGSLLEDGLSAGLNLIPHCVVIPDVLAVPDLNSLLASLSSADVRILALDAPVGVRYDFADDSVTVEGDGSALLAAFKRGEDSVPTVRVQMLSDGMTRSWPKS